MCRIKVKYVFAALAAASLLFSCRVDPEVAAPVSLAPVEEIIPPGWPQPVYRFQNNPVSPERFALGRELFYETQLSADNSVSCGSCHMQESAFAHTGHKLSHGFVPDKETRRNSPGLFNLTWHPVFMHDGAVNHIEVQPLAPITNPIEMGEELNNVIAKLQTQTGYKEMFKAAFGSEDINSERMLKAMAQFMGLLYSYNSKYDRYSRGEGSLNAQELRGLDQFNQKCATCHQAPLFSDFAYRNNGLKISSLDPDSGRARITLDPSDLYRFKTPSLRNIAVTGPYMHDGRFETLQECLDHYEKGISNHINLDPKLENGISLSNTEKEDIIAFLHTLTDYDFIYDKRFSDPNKR